MRAFLVLTLLGLSVLFVGCGQEEASVPAPDPAAAELEKIEAVKVPRMPFGGQAPEEFVKDVADAWSERGPMVLAFFEKYPDHDRAAALMSEYWESRMREGMSDDEARAVIAQIGDAAKTSSNDGLARHAAFWTAFYKSYIAREDAGEILRVADEFTGAFPSDPRGTAIYNFAALANGATAEQIGTAYQRLAEKYPNTPDGQNAAALASVLPQLGKTLELEFDEFRTGRRVTAASLRGKVVVVDFWATWCLPCIESLPRMQATYAAYRSRGVEFVGVSLDEPEENGGKKALTDFLAANEMPWPQFYTDGDPTVPTRFGIRQIPTILIVDRSGVVRTVDGHRLLERTLEQLVNE
ncbi:MAG: TlpA disulfide reductase family protein [Fimbriimonadaceae bacterium]